VCELALWRLAVAELVDVPCVRRFGDGCGLESREAGVHAAPAGADEVHEQRQIVDASVTLGEDVPFDSLEPPDRLVQQAADLCDVSGHGQHLCAEAVAHRGADVRRDRRFEPGCRGRERLDLVA